MKQRVEYENGEDQHHMTEVGSTKAQLLWENSSYKTDDGMSSYNRLNNLSVQNGRLLAKCFRS